MTITPSSGKYYVSFSCNSINGNSNGQLVVQLFINSTPVTGTYRLRTGNMDGIIALQTIITVNGTDVVTVQWYHIGPSDSTISYREITAFRIGA